MAFTHTIPGGRDKGKTLDAAETSSIEWWSRTLSKNLDEGTARNPDRDRALRDAMNAELTKRKGGGGKAPAGPASSAQQPSTALAKTPSVEAVLTVATNDPRAVTQQLESFSQQYHLVSPATSCQAIPPGCGVALSLVRVDPNADKNGPGDVYPVGGGKVGLAGTTLSRIGAAAGVDWDPSQSGRLDNGSDPHYCHFRAVGYVKNFDGSVRTLTGEVEIDARDGSPQINEIRAKAKDRDDKGDSQILELRKFLLRHAERKAKNRAIADMGIKRSYNPAELSKPFAVARLMWTGQSDDPQLRREFALKQADAMIGGMSALYGRPAPQPRPAPAAVPPIQQFHGHAPPQLGGSAVGHDWSDYDDLVEPEPGSSPQASPAPQATPEPAGEVDRGLDPNAY